jgi:hypothetical protein
MTFVFWGLFVVLGLITVGYYWWMIWVERGESVGDRPPDELEGS